MAEQLLPDDYDSPWKEAIEHYFSDCLTFFFPHAAADIDWAKGYEFLDKELQQVVPEAELGRRTVDKLVKVWQKTGQEAWVLIHLEVQSQAESSFAERMYVYNYRLFDRYRRRVASMAILADERDTWRPDSYGYELWGCRVKLEFPAVKLLDYRERWTELEQSHNPFAVLAMAHLHTQATRRKPDERYTLKWALTRRLYERGYSREDIRLLFHFIDWLMVLPPELAQQFGQRLIEYEEEQKMPYVSSVEKMIIERSQKQGLQQGLQQQRRTDVIEVLQIRFKELPQTLVDSIEAIEDLDILQKLHQQAVTVESVEKFSQIIDMLTATSSDNGQELPDL
jgi:hypothetical protein